MAVNALGFLDSIRITVFMSLCDIVGISDRLADHDSLSTQRYFQGKQLSIESLPSFWIMRSQRSRRRDKGLLLLRICIRLTNTKIQCLSGFV